jgi:hypothetical protein
LIACDPHRAAIKLLASLTQREALVFTYNDLLLLLRTLFFFGLMLLPLVGRPQSQTPEQIADFGSALAAHRA